jgi:hypothetical protein
VKAPEAFDRPELNDVQRRAVDSLNESGIVVLQFQDLFGGDLWRDAAADIAPFVRETELAVRDAPARPKKKNELIVRRFFRKAMKDNPEARRTLSLADPWLRIAGSELMLDIVNSYRASWTWLHYVDNWFTVPYPGAEKRIASQRWHRDPEDDHVVKVFLYFSDVDEDAGAFEYIRDSPKGGRYGDLWSWEADGAFYPPQRELEEAVSPDDRLTLTGPTGTLIFADTSGFHRGGFARTKPRVLATFTYVGSGRSKDERRFKVDFAGREATLPPQVRFALD